MCDGGYFLFLLCQVSSDTTKPLAHQHVGPHTVRVKHISLHKYLHQPRDYDERRVYFRAYTIIACLPAVRTTDLPINLSREYHNLNRKISRKISH